MFKVSVLLVFSAILLRTGSARDSGSGSGPVGSGRGPVTTVVPGTTVNPDRLTNCEDPPSSDMLDLARTIKRCQELPLHTEVRATLNHLKSTLPESVRNAVFLNEICIVNKKFNEYMYSPANDFIYDKSTPQIRRIFTWIPGVWNHHGKGDWKLIHHRRNEYFIVAVDNGEYITANDVVVDRRRQVTTTKASPSWLAVNQRRVLWSLEISRELMYLKNLHANEYLYAVDGRNHDDERRTIATWSSNDNGCSGDEQCLWTIKSC